MISAEIVGAWIAVFLTLSIFSYLYKDNPFYKTAEHIFVGVSAGYWASIYFWTQIQPNLFGRLWPYLPEGQASGFFGKIWYGIYNIFNFIYEPAFPDGGVATGHGMNLVYIIPLIIGIMMLLSVFSKLGWFARWGIAYVVGMAAGLRAYGFLNSNVIGQVKGSVIQLTGDVSTGAIINGIILVVGTIAGLMYFYFSKEHKGWFGSIGRIGIYFLMISFGASFGFAVMGRISLLIGRFTDLKTYGGADYHHASLWLLAIMVIILGIWTFTSKDKDEATT